MKSRPKGQAGRRPSPLCTVVQLEAGTEREVAIFGSREAVGKARDMIETLLRGGYKLVENE